MDIKKEDLFELAKSSDPSEQARARELARWEITHITESILDLIGKRQNLMWIIAESKRRSDPILMLDREYELLHKFSSRAWEFGMTPEEIEFLVWTITAFAKNKQQTLLGRDNVFIHEYISPEQLRANLLELTEIASKSYESYWDKFSATRFYRLYERRLIDDATSNVEHGLALDLWCADWETSLLLAKKWFDSVIGFDVSPHMIESAKSRNAVPNVQYREADLFNWIPVKDGSVDFVNANFWAASEVNDDIFFEVRRVLKKWWTAFLSFYNKDALLNQWWQPMQHSIEVIVNTVANIVEVPIKWPDGTKTYKLHWKPYSSDEIRNKATALHLSIEWSRSYPLIFWVMPPLFFSDPSRIRQVAELEKNMAHIHPHMGFYSLITIRKN